MKEHLKGTRLSPDAFAAYAEANGGAQVDATRDPNVITVFCSGKTPERWELKQEGQGSVFWLRC